MAGGERVFGWVVYRLEPWRHHGPYRTKVEAAAARDARTPGWHIRYAEFGVGFDGVTILKDKPPDEN